MAGSRLARRIGAALLLTGLAGLLAAPPAAPGSDATATTSSRARFDVLDSYFVNARRRSGGRNSTQVEVRRNGIVTWTWGRGNSLPHNVRFVSVPRGQKKPRSRTMTRGTFRRRFRKVGRYRFVCTIHRSSDNMRGTVIVRRR